MSEYIDRVKLLEIINENVAEAHNERCAQVLEAILEAPIADVGEVRHGEWVSNELGGYKYAFYCSECGWVDGYPFNDRHKYCPNCGARMDAERSENGNS